MYQTPHHLSDLESQAASGTIAFLAATSLDAGPWQYRLYLLDYDSPDADPDEAGKFLLLRVGENGSVHEVASPRVLTYQSWAEDAFDALWEAQERGELPAADGEPSSETVAAEQDIVARITSRPAVPATRGAVDRAPSGATTTGDDSTPAFDRPQRREDLNDGDLVWHVGDSPQQGPDPEELIEAVVMMVPGTASAEILVQDPDADDEPYAITFDMVVERQIPNRPPPVEAVPYRPQGQENLPPSGPLGRMRANIAAIRTLHVLREEQRPATADEQAVLARWSSWGAVPGIFDPRKRELAGLRAELRSVLTETEWYAAEATTRNAHFTDPALVQPIWQALQDLGFTEGRVLEPGSGSGNFLAFAPGAAQMTGVELDPVTAEISAALYPDATIRAESFVDTRLPEGYFDSAVGNVPFDEIAMTDPVHNPLRLATHNHFIVKSLELVRPGGLVAVLTSRYTLDAMGKTARLEIADRADLVGAVRLPAGAHRRVAGTDAVTDLLILRRRDGTMPATPPEWVGLSPVQISPDTNVLVNSYFAKHPEMILGSLDVTRSQFTDQDITVRPRPGTDLAAELSDVLTTITQQAREAGLTMSASPDAVQRAAVDQRAERMRRAQEMFGQDLQRYEGTILDQRDGTFLQVVGGELDDRSVFRNATQELSSLLRLRDTYIDLLSAESTGDMDQATGLRQQLNQFYGAHTGQYGFLNARDSRRDRRSAHGAFRSDPFAAGVYALEIYDADTQTARRSAIFTRPVTPPQTAQATADTPQDALAISLNTYGEVRLSEIARLLDVDSLDEARDALGDMVFNEPGSQRLIPAAEYLSGNVRAKIEAAEKILAFVSPESRDAHPFHTNIKALRGALPPDKQPGDIDVIQIGVTWVAPKYYEQFLQQLLQSRYVTVTRTSGADWEVDAPAVVRKGRAATKVYGTVKRNAIDLAERLLRRASLVVHPPKQDEDASQQDIQDAKRWAADQTEQTVAKADELNRLFADWLWQDPDRTTAVLHDYNRLFNSFVPYQGDGAHLTFPGLSDAITPRPHQRAGVARVLAEPHGSFLDYEVGFGKTLTIAMSLMEMKRLGMVRKPCIVVKNPTVNDFRNDFLKAYPGARVLAIDSSEFTKETAASYIAQIANGDWDAIILPQSLFKRIPMSGRGQQQFVADQTAEYRARIHKVLTGSDDALSAAVNPGGDPLIADALEAAAAVSTVTAGSSDSPDRNTVKKLQGDLKRHTQRAEKNLVKQTMSGISWEQTGIDFIAVDEVQDFANGEVGANNSELALPVSAQSKDLKIKLRTSAKAFGPKVGLGSTGTPFPNAMPQAYVMLDYFRPDLLAAGEISAFSSFQAQYLTEVVAPEISPEGIPRIKERIGAFRNSLQFSQTWRTMADVKTRHDINMPVPKSVAETIVVPATDEDRAFMEEIAWRADLVRSSMVEPSEDNLLKISNDGRMAAMDLRMIEREPDGPGKLDAAADKIAAIYHEYKDRAYTDRDGNPTDLLGALQLVFADRGTPSDNNRKLGKFVAYEYLRDELFLRGVPVDQIRFAQDAKTAEEKAALFADARLGKVAVLIGSTETMGVGVNVQDRAIALHHVDCPWRPSDVTQREGRIVRQYNQHYDLDIPVQIFRWVKAGSFDSFMWQTVERKARFIDQVRTGRELDEQDAALDGDLGKDYLEFGEIKAIATGNPLLLKKLAADEQVRTLEAAYTNWKRTEDHLQHVVATADETLSTAQRQADMVGRALRASTETKADAFRLELPDGTVVTKRQDAAVALRTKLALIHRQMGMRDGVSGWEEVGTLGGQPFQVRINTVHDFVHFSITGMKDISQAGFTIDDVEALVNGDKAPLGLVTRLENQVERLDGLNVLLLGTVDQLAQEIERARGLVGSPFAKMDKLTRARAEQMQLDAEISGQAGAHHAEEPGKGSPSNPQEMSAADMATHDAQVMAAEFGGTAIVIQDGQWYGTATGVPPTGDGEDSASAAPRPGQRPVVMLPDEELPDFATIPGEVATDPQVMVEKSEAAQRAFRTWTQTQTAQAFLDEMEDEDLEPDEDLQPNGPVTNAVIELHDAYLYALRYRGEDPIEWTRRYGNVVAQSRNLADAFDAEDLPENELLDIVALRQVGDRIQDMVASMLATRAADQAAAAAAEPLTADAVAARPEEAAPHAAASPRTGSEPYEDRAEYWTGEHAALTAYQMFASGVGARLADGIMQEQALVHAAEAMIAESQQARQSRLLGLDHVPAWELSDTLSKRARVVAEQWEREQRGHQHVDEAMAMFAAVRDHAARYRATVEDPASEAFQQWTRSDEPIDLLDEKAEEFIAGLSMTTSYTVTGPAGVRSVPRMGIDLTAGIAQLIADGTVIEETDRGWTLSTPEGNRFDITPAAPASAVDGSATSPGRENTQQTAAETETAPVEETPQAGSANLRARNLAVFLGGYSAPGDLVVARQFIADSVAQVKAAAEARAGTQGSAVDDMVDEVVQAGAAATGAQQVQPADAFGQYDRLADAATRLADGSTGKLAQQAVLLAQRTERHLGRMHGAGRDLFDLLLDAAALDPDSWEVMRRNDPLKERPTPYESSAQLSFARSIVNRTYDQWPALYTSEGAEASDKLRAAMWQIREAPDADSGTALTDWLDIASHALGAAQEADDQGVNRSVLNDVAQRAYQHYQGLAAHQLAAANTPPYGPDRSAAAGAAQLADAWKDWLETASARDLAERSNRPSTDTSLPAERAAQEEIRQAHYAAEWSSLADGTLDDVTRRTSKLAQTTYALVLNMREGGYQQTDDERVLTRLVKLAHEHAAGIRAAAAEPDTASVVHAELAARQEQLRSQAPSEGGAPDVAAPTGAEAPSGMLEIEHHYRGSVVRGVAAGLEDRSVRTALERAGFKESKQKDFWYLPRRMVKTNRDTHVRNLVEELQQLGRRYEMLDEPTPTADTAADDIVIPTGTAYTSLAEAEADVSVMYGAYFETKETAAGKRLIDRGPKARPDGEAVHLALEDLRQGAVGSSLSPFDHPAEDVLQRSATLARALIVLSRHLEEERFRAPVALRHLRTLTQYATLLASRTAATAQAGAWDVLAAPGADPAPAPAAPQPVATIDSVASDTTAEPVTAEPPTIQDADALVAGPYTGSQMLEAFERLDELRRQVIDVLPAVPQPDGIPGPASAGPEEWFRGPARVEVPAGFVPYVNDQADLKPGDVLRIGFKRWLESKRLSYRTLMITGPVDAYGTGWYPAAPNTRTHPERIVAVPPDSRLLTGATADRYTLRYDFSARWEGAVQAGRAAVNGEQPLTVALDLCRQAFTATGALARDVQRTDPPAATRVLAARLLAETEHHLVRLSLTDRVAAETEAAETHRREVDREARQEGHQAQDEETAQPTGPEAKRAELEEQIQQSLAETHEAARHWAIQAATADAVVQTWFSEKQPAEFRSLMGEWLRVRNVPAADGTTSTFSDWFRSSAPGAEDTVAAQVADDVYATLTANAGQVQERPSAASKTAEPEPVVEDSASPVEPEAPANAMDIATTAEGNGWQVASRWRRHSDYSTPYYTVVVEAHTARGWRKFHLTWEMNRGRYTYNAQRSAAGHLSGKSAKEGFRPKLTDVQQAVRALAVPAPTGEDALVPTAAELAADHGEQETLFDGAIVQAPQQSEDGRQSATRNDAANSGTPLTRRHLDALPHRAEQQQDRIARLAVLATLRLPDAEIRDALLLLSNIEVNEFGQDPVVYGAQITPAGARLATSLDAQFRPGDLLAMSDARVLPLSSPLPSSTVERLASLEPHKARLALPLGEPYVRSEPRFATTGQLRTHFKAAPLPHLSAEARRDLAELASQPGFELSPTGQFAIAPESETTWALLAAGSGIELGRVDEYAYLLGSGIDTALAVMGGLPSYEDAVAFSERLGALRDSDGDLIPWDDPRRLPVDRAVYGNDLHRLVLCERAEFDRAAGRDATSQAVVVWNLIAPRDGRDAAPDGQVYVDQLQPGDRIWFDADDEYRIREVVARAEEFTGLVTFRLASLLVTEDGTLEPDTVDEWHVPRNMLLHMASPEEIHAGADIVLALSPGADAETPVAESAAQPGAVADETAEPAFGQELAPPADADAAPKTDMTASPDDQDEPEIVITPDGPGRIMASDDGDLVLVTTDDGTRVWSRSDLYRPGDPTPLSSPDADARGRKNERDREQAATREGIELDYTNGNRLRDLDSDAGHGTIVDSDGEVIGWVRARIGNDGRRYWWAQDAAGGPPEEPFHEGLPPSAGVPAIRAAAHVRDTMPPSHPHHAPIPPESAAREIRLTIAQVRELRELPLDQPSGVDTVEVPEWHDTHRRYVLTVAQMRALADAAFSAAATTGSTTAGQRRRQRVLLLAVERLDAEQYDTARRGASIPPIGRPDPYSAPYERQPRTELPGQRSTPGAPIGQPTRDDITQTGEAAVIAADPVPQAVAEQSPDGEVQPISQPDPYVSPLQRDIRTVPAAEGLAEAEPDVGQAPAPADSEHEENAVAATDDEAAGPWSSRIQITTDTEGTFVSGTGGDFFQQERELRELLKKRGQNFAFRDGRWRYVGRFANRARAVEEIRAYLRAKDAEETSAAEAAAARVVEYPPTPQQQAIIDAVMAGQDVAVQALAGTGKTSTMLMLAKRLPERRIAYIAFNRSIADEGKRKFPRHVVADTSHGFARRVMVNTPLRDKIGKAGRNGGAWRKPGDVAQVLGVTAPLRYRGGKIEPEDVARIVKEAIVKYRESADAEIEAHHLGTKWARTPAAGLLLDVVRRAWTDIADPNSNKLLFAHDDYLKLWALSNPRLDYDLIIFDEAQDINPVLERLIQDQPVQTVVVGDSHQAIYEFRGAIDALKDWPADQVLPLTQSWRFGPEVAALGTAYLELLGSDLVLEGNPALATSVGLVEAPDAVLSRTNVGAIGAVVAGFEAGKRVALVGGGREIEDVARAAQDLQRGRRTKNPELASFGSWHEVREHADTEGDKSLQMFVRLVDKYRAEGLIDMIKNLVPEDARSEETRPEIVVSTAHKAKGREWDNVRVADDFPEPEENESGELVLDPGELRLAYVTVTRAKNRLELGSLAWIRTLNRTDVAAPPAAAAVIHDQQTEVDPGPVETAARRQADMPTAETAVAPQEPTGLRERPARLTGPPFVDVVLSEGDRGEFIIAATFTEGGDELSRAVERASAAVFSDLALPLVQSLPAPVRPPGAAETLISDDEVAAWLGEHLPNGPLAPAWQVASVREALVGTLRTAVRTHLAPSQDEIATWLVGVAPEHDRLVLLAQANDETNFTAVFGSFADELMDGASETLLWGYLHGQRRQAILEAAAPLVYRALRALPTATAPDAQASAAAEFVEPTDGPSEAATEPPVTEVEEPTTPMLLFGDGEEQEATPEEITALLTGMTAADGTSYLGILNDSQPGPEPASSAGPAGTDTEQSADGRGPVAPLPWDDAKIGKRAQSGKRRAETSPIPKLARQIGDALGLTMARVVWEMDRPFDQFRENLRQTLDGFGGSDTGTRQLVADVAADLERGITQIAQRAAAHYTDLIETAGADPVHLAAVNEQLEQATRSPEFEYPHYREALVLVMRTIDEAERTARQRRVKPATVRTALDQVVGLAGSVFRDGEQIPLMPDVLVPLLAQLDAAREGLARVGHNPAVLEENTRLRRLIAEYEDRQAQAGAEPVVGEEAGEASQEIVEAGQLMDEDIAAAILRFDDWAFGRLIFDMDAERPRRPEAYGTAVSVAEAAESGLLFANQSGMELTVSAEGTVVRRGKLSWAKTLTWLRPALTTRRRELVLVLWTTGNRLRRTETGFAAIGERAHYAAARSELGGLARTVQERIVDDALGAHRSGVAAVLAAHNSKGAVAADGALISLDDVIDGIEGANSEDEERMLERVRQLRAVLPEQHSTVRELRNVQPGDLFQSVSARRLPFLARSGMSSTDGRLSVDGVLIGPDGETIPYTWSESWWTPEERLQPLLLPDSLADLVALPGQNDQPTPVEAKASLTPAEPLSVEPISTEVPAPPTTANSLLAAEDTAPTPDQPSTGQEPETTMAEAQPVTEALPDTQAVGYRELGELLHDLVETDRLHALWASSPTGRLLLADAQELREETGAVDANEAARVDIALAALMTTVDAARARSGLLLGASRNLTDVVAAAGRSLGERGAFESSGDRELLLDVYITARDVRRRLEATDDLQQMLDSAAGGAWLLTRYRRRPEEPAPVSRTAEPGAPRDDAAAGADEAHGEPEPGAKQEAAPALVEPQMPQAADSSATAGEAEVPDGPAPGKQPAEEHEGFDFWRDVIGDDLVVGGVVYDSDVYGRDGEGGVRRREEDDEPWPPSLAEQEDQARMEEEDMAIPVADSSQSDQDGDVDLDRAFEDVVAMLGEPVSTAGASAKPPALRPTDEQHLRTEFDALRQLLSQVLTDIDAEPIIAEPADPAVESSEAADLNASMDTARAEVGYYWGTPEWTAIRSISQAARDFRGAVREAAFDYAESTLADIRTIGLDRTIQARTARAVSHISLALARRLERSGQRDTRGWRAVWGLHRAAATLADRIVGNLPSGQRIHLAEQLRRAWQWLGQRIAGGDLEAAADADPGRMSALLNESMKTINRLYQTAAERLGNLAEHPAWRRIASVWASARGFVDRARMGAGRMMADHQTLGTLRMLWVRTLEIISHGARFLMTRLDASGERDGLRWNVLRAVRHAAEDHIAQAHGHLAEGVSTPLGTYEPASLTPDREERGPAADDPSAPSESATKGKEQGEDRFREVALAVAQRDFLLPMDLTFTHGVPFADAVTMLERMEQVGIVTAPREGDVREVLVDPDSAREILRNLTTPQPTARRETPPRQPALTAPAATEEQPTVKKDKTTELPQRRRAKGPGEPSQIAAASALRSTAAPARPDQPSGTRDQFITQALRLRARADLAKATASTPAEKRRADVLNKIADRTFQAAADLSHHGPGTGRTPSGGDAVTTEAYIAALHVHAAARGDQIPDGLLEGAMQVAADARRQAPHAGATESAAAPQRKGREARSQAEEQNRPVGPGPRSSVRSR